MALDPRRARDARATSGSSDRTDDLTAGDGFVARLERAVAPFAHRFASAPGVLALRESLPVAFGIVVLVIAVPFFTHPFGGWAEFARELRDRIPVGFSIASVAMVVVLAVRLALRSRYSVAALTAAAVVSFWVMLPRDALAALVQVVETRGASGWGAFAATLGASGLFTAIVVCFAAAGGAAAGRKAIGRRYGELAGGAALVALAWALYAAHASPAAGIAALIAPLGTLGDSFVALALITAVEAMLWLVGIHGPALLAALVLPVYLRLQFENTHALAQHLPIPHVVVVSTFLFVFPGGAGATLPLVALLLRSRVTRLRKFALATIVPSLINVNEPVIFGLPLAYNPVLALPFVVTPVALACTTYAAMAFGWVTRPLFYMPSTIPIFVNVFLATLDWRDCVLFAVNLAIGAAIWLPFVRVFERTEAARLQRAQ